MIFDVAPGIKFIRAEKAGFPYCHCLMIESDIRAIIDSGAGPNILASIQPSTVDLLINTHYHRDHTNGNHLFENARVLVNPLDYPPLVDEQARLFYTGFYRWEEIMENTPYIDYRKHRKNTPPFQPHKIDGFIKDGDVIDFGHTRAVVVHTPGHTPGHTSFYFEKEGLFFGSDMDLIPSGPWYGDYMSNLMDIEASIQRIIEIDPAIYCCSHRKPVSSDIKARLLDYVGQIEKAAQKVEQMIAEPASAADITGKYLLYKNYDDPYSLFYERIMIEKHLDRLVKQGRAEMVEEDLYRATNRKLSTIQS